MPDIKTALSSALKEWDKPITNNTEDKQMQTQPKYDGFKVTSNVGRLTFEMIKNNPNILPHQITAWAKTQGLNPDSAYAVAAKSVRDEYMVRTPNGGFKTIVPEYKSPKTKVKKAKPKTTAPSKGIKALLPIPKPEPTPILERTREEPFVLTAKYVIENIKVGEAKLLHKELTRIFTED
jgi:hypothetical protein